MATPKNEMKPTAAEMLKLVPVSVRAQTRPWRGQHVGQHGQRVQQGTEGRYTARRRSAQREGDNDYQPAFGVLHFLEFAADRGEGEEAEEAGRLRRASGRRWPGPAANAELDGDQPSRPCSR